MTDEKELPDVWIDLPHSFIPVDLTTVTTGKVLCRVRYVPAARLDALREELAAACRHIDGLVASKAEVARALEAARAAAEYLRAELRSTRLEYADAMISGLAVNDSARKDQP